MNSVDNDQYDQGSNSLSTLNTSIIQALVDKPKIFLPSQVMKIVHRTIAVKNLQNYNKFCQLSGIKSSIRGVFLETTPDMAKMHAKGSIFYEGGKMLYGVIYPGFFKGKQVMDLLDDAFLQSESKLVSDTYHIAAFYMAVACAAHVFVEANGRSAVGLAKYIIDKYSGKTLSLEKLQTVNDDLAENLALCTIGMFPSKENITKSNSPTIVDLRTYTTEEEKDFIIRFWTSIKDHIYAFNDHDTTHNKYVNEKLSILEKLLKDASM